MSKKIIVVSNCTSIPEINTLSKSIIAYLFSEKSLNTTLAKSININKLRHKLINYILSNPHSDFVINTLDQYGNFEISLHIRNYEEIGDDIIPHNFIITIDVNWESFQITQRSD